MKKTFLLDINVWIALSFRTHVSNAKANEWFMNHPDDNLIFCRVSQMGFLRLATNKKVMGDDTVTLRRAWEMFDSMMSDPKIDFALEPAGFESQWRAFTQGGTFSQNVWSDAYLAAFAQSGNYELVTLDQGFRQYPGLSVTILS